MNLDTVIAESERLAAWSTRWLRLANDMERMRAMGNLQSSQDYIIARSQLANAKRGRLLRQWWAHMDSPEYAERTELARLKAKYEGTA